MDNLVSLLKAYGGAAVNDDVKMKILDLIQAWASATEGRLDLSYVGETYRALQVEGFRFPPKVEVLSSMLDSSAPPEWIDSDVCMRCRMPFTFRNRKHHCRNCGNVFCGPCSSKSIPLPHLGLIQSVRVDDGCYTKLTDKLRGAAPPIERPADRVTGTSRPRVSFPMQARDARGDEGYDEDLRRALEMSLEEVRHYSSTGYVPQSRSQTSRSRPLTNGPPKSSAGKTRETDEDPELKAAIAASLADMEEQKKTHATKLKEQAAEPKTHKDPLPVPVRNDYELTPVEAENINLFSTLVDRLQSQPPGTILREPQIQELYDSIGSLRPKLARTYGETMSKHGERVVIVPLPSHYLLRADALLDLHAKLSTVVRYYDRMLEERLSNTYSHYGVAGYQPSASARGSSAGMYPSIAQGSRNPPSGAEGFYTEGATAPYGADYQDHGRRSVAFSPAPFLAENLADNALTRMQSPPTAQPHSQPQYYSPQQYSNPTLQSAPPFSAQEDAVPAGSGWNKPSHLPPQTFPAVDADTSFYYGAADHSQALPSYTTPSDPALYGPHPSSSPSVSRVSQPLPAQHQHHAYDERQNHASAAPQQLRAQEPPPYGQQPPQTLPQPQAAPAVPYSSFAGYTPESFPSAPRHQPQPKQVEESLIEL
ncbi:MAG: Vacuolar protein-sorting-associated protein 27 [Phylliscum demangeonii]|nr:MAG: Vacuolar protein-sorting-associated protein 27 [Phylliscum demangeonii]